MATIDEFKQLELKVAKIIEAKIHPNADKLLVLTIDTGGVQKEIVAGIALHYKPSDLLNKLVVVVDNLQPATIRGVVSNGMLLVAHDGEGLILIAPERPVMPGSPVR